MRNKKKINLELIRKIIKFILSKFYRFLFYTKKHNSVNFPLSKDSVLLLGNEINFNKCSYFIQIFKFNTFSKFDFMGDPSSLITEIFPINNKTKRFFKVFDKSSLVQFTFDRSFKDFIFPEEENISIKIDGKEYYPEYISKDRVNYLQLPDNSSLEIDSRYNKIIIGESIINNNSKHNPKLVLPIFIDGLGSKFFDFIKFEECMPNTAQFFKKGAIFFDARIGGEWTLPSIANIFTGQYTHHHGLFHPNSKNPIASESKLLPEYYKEAGYLTAQFCNNWRKSPLLGYVRGFNRTIYGKDFDISNTIFEMIDHIKAFSDYNLFIWSTLFELHNRIHQIPKASIQTQMPYRETKNKKNNLKSTQKQYDLFEIDYHIEEIKNIDFYLGILYEFIEKMYNESDILVLIISDHGQSYLSEELDLLSTKRCSVPLMFKGKNVPNIKSENLIQTVDIVPSILKFSGIPYDGEKLDGILIKEFGGHDNRSFTLSESLFPKTTYKAVFRELKDYYSFESKDIVDESGFFDLSSIYYTGSIISEKSNFYYSQLINYLKSSIILNKRN